MHRRTRSERPPAKHHRPQQNAGRNGRNGQHRNGQQQRRNEKNGHQGQQNRNNGRGQHRNGQAQAPAVAANPDNIATVGFMRRNEPRRTRTGGDAEQNLR